MKLTFRGTTKSYPKELVFRHRDGRGWFFSFWMDGDLVNLPKGIPEKGECL